MAISLKKNLSPTIESYNSIANITNIYRAEKLRLSSVFVLLSLPLHYTDSNRDNLIATSGLKFMKQL